ncbi:Ig-like domain-containing protein [Pseudoalteromonas luteoviolacea]|uniref:Fibronectin type-III domain-containing protein n=1 Tax=Pseudoalteromonas luteoviolacea DSM 6061 TaxID=1365250 RepID=A0A166Y750_9GAMM|nr:Ig-like domain-containing protein [Pseudoalteromonas luteoviolacea]KZN41513.1 hypothetical protein N475_10605 [Pseudoalteromonas luteoviolacea DSM 6061]MBE0385487.1 hypothetical protein [Pseudoalteromonas luteoviolacea DSM 6061]
MSHLNKATLLLVTLLGATGCGSGKSNPTAPAKGITTDNLKVSISGSVEKGPFVVGSTITINKLSETGENTSSTIVTKTKDDLGNFEFTAEADSILEISAFGYYRNEITGELSRAPLTLRTIYKASNDGKQSANINLLTHLTSNRILELIKDNKVGFEVALKQAEEEFSEAFKNVLTSSDKTAFSKLSIYKDSDSEASAYLLTVSSMLYQYAIEKAGKNGTTAEAELTAFINNIEKDFALDGIIEDTDSLISLSSTQKRINPDEVNANILKWIEGTDSYSAPDINEFLDSDLDGIANLEDEDDDNDGIKDQEDSAPFKADFVIADQSLSLIEDSSLQIDVTSNNPAGDDTAIVFNVLANPKYGVVRGDYPHITYTPRANFNGTDEFTFQLTQGAIASKTVKVQLVVAPVNDAPVINGAPQTSLRADEAYEFVPSTTDVDGDDLKFAIENQPSWLSFDSTTGSLKGTPTNRNVGSFKDIKIKVSDEEITTELPTFSIAVDYGILPAPSMLNHRVTLTDDTLKPIVLAWGEVEYASSYQVQISKVAQFTSDVTEVTVQTPATSFETQVTPGRYYWRVRSVNPSEVAGEWSLPETIEAGVFKYAFGNESDRVRQTINTLDGGYLIFGSNSTSNSDWVVKINGFGKQDWELTFKQNDSFGGLSKVYELKDGNILAIGREHGKTHAYGRVIDQMGNQVGDFSHTVGQASDEGKFADVVETDHGVYISYVALSDSKNTHTIHKLDLTNGTISSPINVPEIGQNIDVNGYKLASSNSGNLLIYGDAHVANAPQEGWRHGPFIIELDSAFTPVFSYENVDKPNNMTQVHLVKELKNGNFVLSGYTAIESKLMMVSRLGELLNDSWTPNSSTPSESIEELPSGQIAVLLNGTEIGIHVFSSNLAHISEEYITEYSEHGSAQMTYNSDGTITLSVNPNASSAGTNQVLIDKRTSQVSQ